MSKFDIVHINTRVAATIHLIFFVGLVQLSGSFQKTHALEFKFDEGTEVVRNTTAGDNENDRIFDALRLVAAGSHW